MKKSLIALAVLAASGAAMAQSSVTMFGVVDTGVTYLKGTGNAGTKNYGLSTGGNASSRIGFRGVEDLGGGLKAGFWLESGFNSDAGDGKAAGASGTGLEFARRSTVSLMGNFGEVRLGRDETAAYNKLSAYSNFSVIGAGGFRGWNTTVGNDIRQNNMIAYFTPNFSGFTAGVNYAFGESTLGGAYNRYVGGFAAYNNGPLSVTVGADHKNGIADGKNGFAGGTVETYGLGASYNFGVAKVNGLVLQAKEKGTSANAKQTSYALGVSAPVGGVGEVKAQYALYNANTNNIGDAGKAHQLSLGYVHNLSKRTALYGTYSYMKNKGGRALTLINGGNVGTGAGYATSANGNNHGIQVGIRHAF